MALTPCKSCKHKVDSSANVCPNCGVANPGVTAGHYLIGFIFLAGIIFFGVKMCSGGSDEEPKDAVAPVLDDAACKKNLKCWGEKFSISAAVYCKDPIAKLGKYSSRWTDGTFESKLSRLKWLDKDAGTITYIGDKIEFQNGFGAFQKHIYECDFDPEQNQVLSARARPGQLPD
ncbi:hypothetical protein [Pseudomonas phoenicis]|uniref:hypothetical protein n=1 Tax=unclassified Pseudomonas TaxID=196821 RepID=UPI0039A1C7D5